MEFGAVYSYGNDIMYLTLTCILFWMMVVVVAVVVICRRGDAIMINLEISVVHLLL